MNRMLQARKNFALGILAPLALGGCQTVQLVSDYDESTDQAAAALQRKVSDHLIGLETLPVSDPKLRFSANQSFYQDVTVDVNAMQVRAAGIRKNRITQDQLQLLEDSLSLLILQHKGCMQGAVSAEQSARIRENGPDLTNDCRTEFGASADIPNRASQPINPRFVRPARGQFEQSLGAIMAFEVAKKRGETNGQ